MSLKTELAEKKEALAALKERIEADDPEAIAEGLELKAAIETKEAEIKAAEEKASLLDTIGEKKEEESTMEGLKALDLESLKSHRGSVSTFVDVKTAGPVEAPTVTTFSDSIVSPADNFGVRDLFLNEQISGNVYSYIQMGAIDGDPAITAEGAEKPMIEPAYTQVNEALVKVAAYLKETDELLSDSPRLESAIRGRGVWAHNSIVESTILSDILATSGIDVTVNSGISFDNLLAAKMAVFSNTGYTADAIVINPVDLEALLATKDQHGQYMLGGPAYGPYGNGGYNAYPSIWGMRVVPSAGITQGTALVGAFKPCAGLVTKAGEGLRVEVSNSNEDDFIKNLVTVRIEERLALAVYLPGGFAKVYTQATT